ncbi:hypothetical protein [Sphingomonas paucimobilis]|uniref:Uncharacterized protein n=1 Tax=Sphingomonas paucimobilis TaxID=13689 RepID=A0A7T3AA19_SPHPI|nr:hypothetical protein [Sphingomonas paucimobilis]QPT08602.1 hypothetical protein I6G38_18095 [Sphingomonas paucimobilis]
MHSPTPRPAIAADPVIETRTVRQLVCPAEITAPLPPSEPMPEGAVMEAARDVLRWIGRRFAREEMLARRITDAKAECDRGGK